jgi:rubredoxin
MSLKFKCPSCKKEDLEIIETDVTMTSLIVEIDDEICFEYDLIDTGGGNVDRFQCSECGFVLKDDDEQIITTEEDVVEWIRGNCEQEAGK